MFSRKEFNIMGKSIVDTLQYNVVSYQTSMYAIILLFGIVTKLINIDVAFILLLGALSYLALVIILVEIHKYVSSGVKK